VLSQRVRTQVIGDRVVSEVDVRSDRLEAAGLAPLRLTAETVIRDGLIHSARTEMAPPVAARVSEARNKGIVELLYRALSAHELTILDRLVRDDFVDQSPRPGFAANRDGLAAYQETLIEGMSNLRYRLDHTVAEGDLVVVRWTMSGTHDGDLFGLGPTRRQVSLTGTESFRLENWQIVERWANVDDADLIQQIGVGV
jgi:predicted ester cyclase